jgi:Asp/Glu/hydantoin racemase
LTKPALYVGHFYIVELRRKIETAHGLLDVIDSVAAEVARHLHLYALHLCTSRANNADE